MLPERRRQRITELLERRQSIRVLELAAEFGVSTMTVRRDLQRLHAESTLRRVRGGAIARVRRAPFQERAVENQDAKQAIARRTLELIEDDEALMLDIGTTVFYVAQQIAASNLDVFVLTNSINAAVELSNSSATRVLLCGGFVRGGSEPTTVGDIASEVISRFRVDTLVLGVGGIDLERGLLYYDVEEVGTRRSMLAAARRVIVVADHTKFGSDQFAALVPLERVDTVVTNQPPSPSFRAAMKRCGTELIVASDAPRRLRRGVRSNAG